jgi:predicted RNase H-like nuclease
MKNVCVGVDGCRAGWLAVAELTDRSIRARVYPSFSDLVESFPTSTVIAIDIPIGLPEKSFRTCDRDTRRALGVTRGSSVFPAPLRAVLKAKSYSEACQTRLRIDAKKMSLQAWGIVPKVREVDKVLLAKPELAHRIYEAHPEATFAHWAGEPQQHSKKTAAGRRERFELIESVWPGAVAQSRGELRGADYQVDDLYDAFAVLWTARRIVAGKHRSLPSTPESDSKGLPMRIVI